MANPFFVGGRIENPADFVGRKSELHRIFSSLESAQWGQAQHFNIVAPRRMGKSSLLYYISNIFQKYLERGTEYQFIYVDLDDPRCHTRKGLLNYILEELGFERNDSLLLEEFYDVLIKLREKPDSRWIVLCLDEFEHLIDNKEEFPDQFYNTWRSLGNSNILSFLIVSHSSLSILAGQGNLTSPFFNIFTILMLGEFSEDDSLELLGRAKAYGQPFNSDETKWIMRLARNHPYKLQLASKLLFDAKKIERNVNYSIVEKEFQIQSGYIFNSVERITWYRVWSNTILICIESVLRTFGRALLTIFKRSEQADKSVELLFGIGIVVTIIAILIGWLEWGVVEKLLRDWLQN